MELNRCPGLDLELRDHGVLLVTINRPGSLNALDKALHRELSRIWFDIADDPDVRVVVLTGAETAFSAGGDFEMIVDQTKNIDRLAFMLKETGDIVYNMLGCDKPIISAINGVAVGAGLSIALLADISVMSTDARINDGHLRLGVAAGDHATLLWPLLCGMAKAKYYLLTAEFIDGREAERIGLVSRCVPPDEVLPVALQLAERIATGPQLAVRWTKRALNQWLRMAGPAFETSLALEMLSFFGDDVEEGVRAIREHRRPRFE
jgi:enoyl-CoA hydratase